MQIGLNAVAILGGIVGDAAFSPAFHSLLSGYLSPELSEQLSFIISLPRSPACSSCLLT
nr:Uncharacterised protein [Klebsiella pneumoniae]